MKVRTKLILGFSLIVIFLWLIAFHAAASYRSLRDQFSTLGEDILPCLIAINEIESTTSSVYHYVRGYVFFGAMEEKTSVLSGQTRLENIGQEHLMHEAYLGEKEQAYQLMSIMTVFNTAVSDLINRKEQGASLDELLNMEHDNTMPALLALQQETGKYKEAEVKEVVVLMAAFGNTYTRGIFILFLSAGLITLLSAAAAVLTTRSIIRPLHALHRGTEMVEKGNLDYRVGTGAKDEIGQLSRAFDHMTRSLTTSMTSIQNLNEEINRRKQTEEALRDSEEFNASLLENAPHPVTVINPDTSIRYVSPSFEKLTGFAAAEILGHEAPYPWWPEESKEAFKFRLIEDMASGINHKVERLLLKKNGESFWGIQSTISVYRQGTLAYFLVNWLDITRRKHMETALQEKNEQLDAQNEKLQTQSEELTAQHQELLEKSTELEKANAILAKTECNLKERVKELRCLYNISALAERHELTLDQLYQEVTNLLPAGWQYPEITSSEININGRSFQTGNHRASQWRQSASVIVYDKKTGYVEVCYQQEKPEADEGPFLTEERLLLEAAAERIGRITERRQTEEALSASEERFRLIAETSPDYIVQTDKLGYITYTSPAVRYMLGYEPEERKGQNFSTLIPPSSLAVAKAVMAKASMGETLHNIEVTLIHKDGRLVPMEANIAPIIENNEVTGLLGIVRDITERKQAEERMHELDRMKSEFLSNVSHELRNPLHSARGFVKLLLNNEVPDPRTQKEFLTIIDKEARRLNVLIDDLLDMSRLEAGRFNIQKQRLVLRDFIHEQVESFATIAGDKGMTIKEDLPADMPVIEADGNRIKQVISNLLSNAIKFSDNGNIKIKSSVRDNEVLVQIIDHGIGIPEEAKPHLFERFFRAKDNMARGGTGLGLYISREIIEAHGGRIWVKSKEGKGSTFSFTLPLDNSGGDTHEQKDSGDRR
jgi:PAS domain S-box-containing protein